YLTRSLFTSRCMAPALRDDSTSIQADSTIPFGLSTDSNRPPSRAAIAVSQTWSNEQPDEVIGLSSVRHPGTRHTRDNTMRAGRTIDVISKRRGILTSALLKSKASAGTQRTPSLPNRLWSGTHRREGARLQGTRSEVCGDGQHEAIIVDPVVFAVLKIELVIDFEHRVLDR